MSDAPHSVGPMVPGRQRSPLAAIVRRIASAIGLIVFIAIVVRVGRDGYTDVTGDPISLLDALYYASVTVTTTGYGDITAVTEGTRLATLVFITPARIVFLILLVGTTVEVLTDQTRHILRTDRWRKRVNNHIVICGFGATGRSAAADLRSRGRDADSIVVVDIDPTAIDHANSLGYVGIAGDATTTAVLHDAMIERAEGVIVAPNRDDTAVLITLTARELNPTATIVAGGREQENLHLLQQGGADQVIDATAAVGRLLGLAMEAPGAVRAFDDMIDAGSGLELVECGPEDFDNGGTLVAIERDGKRLPPKQVSRDQIRPGDRLVIVRESQN
ncbi:MAG: voltage-gated potassium channel [Acidimicrobiales bacterium]|jgi:voltage-gated potassium channel